MKLKLFLIIMALLAAKTAVFAESGEIFFEDEPAGSDAVGDIAIEDLDEIAEMDMYLIEEMAQLNGEAIPWDGVTLAEPPVIDGAYEISNGAQLAWVAEQVNSQTDAVGKYSGMNGYTIRLAEDIDLGGHEWTPIGYSYERPFAGEFDGDGHSVSGLVFDASSYTNCGLFGCVLGTVKNVDVHTVETGIETQRHVTPSSGDYTKYGIGIVAGSVDDRKWDYDNKQHTGSVENCAASGSLSVTNTYGENVYIGGVVGVNSGGSMVNNMNNAAVSVESKSLRNADRAFVGGVVGCNYGEIIYTDEFAGWENSSAAVSAVSSNPYVGAVAGANAGMIRGAAYNGERLGIGKYESAYDSYAALGAIAGLNGGTIEACSFEGEFSPEITALTEETTLAVGGIAGAMTDLFERSGIIDDCTASGRLAVNADAVIQTGFITGGITDENAVITDCGAYGSGLEINGASKAVSAGAIAGYSRGSIDSCHAGSLPVSVKGAAQINAGGVVGESFNTVTDCVSQAVVSVECGETEPACYAGGIAGAAYGEVIRSSFDGTVSDKAAKAYAGGISGYIGYSGESVNNSSLITKCRFSSGASVRSAYICGGIAGRAGSAVMSQCVSYGALESDGEGSASAGGLAGSAGGGLSAENCFVKAKLGADAAAGAVFETTSPGSSISASYIEPVFADGTMKYAIAQKPENITAKGVYVSGIEAGVEGVTEVSGEEAAKRSTFTADTDGGLDFSNIWLMGETSPELQFEVYSNSYAALTDATISSLSFRVTTENPIEGTKAYAALYNGEGRFCGAVSAQVEQEYINKTGTKAEFALEYGYNYWFNPKNYDENGIPKPGDEWIPSEYVPTVARVFTWGDTSGMRDLSSVDEIRMNIEFDD